MPGSKIRKFLELTGGDRCLLISAGFWLLVFRLGLALFPFQFVRKLIYWLVKPAGEVNLDETLTSRVVWAVRTVNRGVPATGTCLPRAMVAYVMLSRRMLPAELRIGVRRQEEEFEAHAWVVSGGRVVVGNLDDLESYSELPLSGVLGH
jgi:hypothetical protein